MNWAETLIAGMKKFDISFITYVPDISIYQVTKLMDEDPFFKVVPATREEESIGLATGAYAVGRRSAIFMQSSGLGNCINAIGSLSIPCRTPIPFFINVRGELGEFNINQVPMGRVTRPILDLLGIPHYTLTSEDRLDSIVAGALDLCYASRQPLALCLSPLLHRGRLA
jgi:sulfopyruvate decarboxylase subunit alpha